MYIITPTSRLAGEKTVHEIQPFEQVGCLWTVLLFQTSSMQRKVAKNDQSGIMLDAVDLAQPTLVEISAEN